MGRSSQKRRKSSGGGSMFELDLGFIRIWHEIPPVKRVLFVSLPTTSLYFWLVIFRDMADSVSSMLVALMASLLAGLLLRMFWDVVIRG